MIGIQANTLWMAHRNATIKVAREHARPALPSELVGWTDLLHDFREHLAQPRPEGQRLEDPRVPATKRTRPEEEMPQQATPAAGEQFDPRPHNDMDIHGRRPERDNTDPGYKRTRFPGESTEAPTQPSQIIPPPSGSQP